MDLAPFLFDLVLNFSNCLASSSAGAEEGGGVGGGEGIGDGVGTPPASLRALLSTTSCMAGVL